MSTRRGYDLVCPIARALDRVGDRWTLLILRDLHAGPARFSDLETGLGTASNLLSSRLRDLIDDGLITRTDTGAYALTSIGEHTAGLILELSNLGLLFDPPPEPKQPGNLRTVYLPLRETLRAAPVWPRAPRPPGRRPRVLHRAVVAIGTHRALQRHRLHSRHRAGHLLRGHHGALRR